MKGIFTCALMLVAFMAVSCSGMRKFDCVETTSVERYNIVYKDNKCGLYDKWRITRVCRLLKAQPISVWR